MAARCMQHVPIALIPCTDRPSDVQQYLVNGGSDILPVGGSVMPPKRLVILHQKSIWCVVVVTAVAAASSSAATTVGTGAVAGAASATAAVVAFSVAQPNRRSKKGRVAQVIVLRASLSQSALYTGVAWTAVEQHNSPGVPA